MSITAIATAAGTQGQGYGQSSALPASRALVPVEAVEAKPRPVATGRVRRITPDAALVAHLWAVRENAPQMRARRRAAPGTAEAAYQSAAQLKDHAAGSFARTV